jgi:uncharacterized protein (TIGR00290 family)
MNQQAFMNWSGGKDSALALYIARQAGITVGALVTSINASTNRISMHGVRKDLLQKQADSIGLPLQTIVLPEMPGMQAFEEMIHQQNQQLKKAGYTHAIFGDIFLEDLKKYREELLRKDDLQCLFPLWNKNTREVLQEFFTAGFKAIVICVNSQFLDKSFCGRLLDESFIADLPPSVDLCGENGEYHSFVFDGPNFTAPIHFEKGEIVFKEYAAPKMGDDCFTTPQQSSRFYFQDLITL